MKPVVALDIDGTLGDWHSAFIDFASAYMGKEYPKPCTQKSLYRHLRMSKSTYRQVKLAFRQSGLKRSMPVDPYASTLVRNLRRHGCAVWICTTRPYLRLDNIDPDTRAWLRRNRITPDGVLFGERKYRDLAKIHGTRMAGTDCVLGVLDDLPELCSQAMSVGLRPILRRATHNRWWPPAEEVGPEGPEPTWELPWPEVETLEEAEKLLLERLYSGVGYQTGIGARSATGRSILRR